jgi:hypothetical protein
MVDDPPTPLITDWIPPNPAVLRKMVSRSWNDTPDVGDWNAIAEKMLTPWLKNEYEPIPPALDDPLTTVDPFISESAMKPPLAKEGAVQ